MIDAIRTRDNQVIVGVVLFVSVRVILMNLIVDLLYFCARSAHSGRAMTRR